MTVAISAIRPITRTNVRVSVVDKKPTQTLFCTKFTASRGAQFARNGLLSAHCVGYMYVTSFYAGEVMVYNHVRWTLARRFGIISRSRLEAY